MNSRVSRLSVKGRMYVIIALTLVMFIVNAQFAWVNVNKVNDLGLDLTRTVLLDSQRQKIKVATEITGEIGGVNEAANRLSDAGTQVQERARALNGLAEEFNTVVSSFKI